MKDFFKDGSDRMIWYPHKKLTDAYVFTEDETKQIIDRSTNENWEFKPIYKVPAQFENGKVSILGEKIRI